MAFSEWFQSHSVDDMPFASAQREWRGLQTAIQISKGRSSLLLRVVPVGSVQYRLAQRLFRSRSANAQRAVISTSPVQFVEPFANWQDEVEVVVMDSRSVSDINAQILASRKPWIFPVSESDDPGDIARLAWHLLGTAHSESAIRFTGDRDTGSPMGVGPHTLLSYNVVGRGAVIPRRALLDVGGFDPSARDVEHDLYLRLSEAGYNFLGLPAEHKLCSSAAPIPETTMAALRRRGFTGTARASDAFTAWSLMGRPTVDIVIPTRDRLDLLRACLTSVEENCGDFAVSITIVDNDSREPETLEFFRQSPHRIVAHPGPFNYAEIINHGVATGVNDVVVILNNDTIVQPGWLDGLVPLAMMEDVGVVGATLISPNGDVQHAGMGAVPYPVELPYGLVPSSLVSDYVVALSHRQCESIRNVVAVTGACHVVERTKWNLVGGMDETLKVTANDVDLCLRLSERGYYTVLNPSVVITHVGKASRGNAEAEDDHIRFLQRWGFLRELVDPCIPYTRATLISQSDIIAQ